MLWAWATSSLSQPPCWCRSSLPGAEAVEYALLDGETVVVTTGAQGIADFAAENLKLADSARYQQAAERVVIEERTSGFLYLDIDGLIPFIEDASGEPVPDARDVVAKIDAFAARDQR